jgi:hypothetical protein
VINDDPGTSYRETEFVWDPLAPFRSRGKGRQFIIAAVQFDKVEGLRIRFEARCFRNLEVGPASRSNKELRHIFKNPFRSSY